jgi:aspartyl-tRNA(Asn)/glutamyl-tRNA(Gln) amidotransferase subunit C
VSVTRDDVLAVAALARLRLTDQEATLFTTQLADILEHVEELQAATAAASEPEPDESDRRAPLRLDQPPADALERPPSEIAPDWRDGFFTVPRLDAMHPGPASGPESP